MEHHFAFTIERNKRGFLEQNYQWFVFEEDGNYGYIGSGYAFTRRGAIRRAKRVARGWWWGIAHPKQPKKRPKGRKVEPVKFSISKHGVGRIVRDRS